MSARLGDIVAVRWVDAWEDSGQTTEKDWKENLPMVTYGVLMRDGDTITVASEVMPDGEFRAVTHIPRGIVLNVEVLRTDED